MPSLISDIEIAVLWLYHTFEGVLAQEKVRDETVSCGIPATLETFVAFRRIERFAYTVHRDKTLTLWR